MPVFVVKFWVTNLDGVKYIGHDEMPTEYEIMPPRPCHFARCQMLATPASGSHAATTRPSMQQRTFSRYASPSFICTRP